MVVTPTLALGKTIYENDTAGIPYYLLNFVVVNLGTALLQHYIPEKRPSNNNWDSFPSGHASAAFSGASYVHFRYSLGEARWLYVLASFVAFSRVYSGCHHVQDVVASAGFSYLSGLLLVKHKLNISLNYDSDKKGISLNIAYGF
jgi:membrane-associated phospholipid phosphatase